MSRVEQLMMENASLREERDQTSKELEDYKIKVNLFHIWWRGDYVECVSPISCRCKVNWRRERK